MSKWIKFELIDRPYYDENGNTLKRGLYTTKYGLSKIYGGGKVYPDLSKVKVLEQYEKGDTLIVLIDGDKKEVDELLKVKDVTFEASPKEVKIEKDGFKVKLIDEKDKDKELIDIGVDISDVTIFEHPK